MTSEPVITTICKLLLNTIRPCGVCASGYLLYSVTLPSSAAVLQTARWHTCHDVTRLSAVSLSNLAARSLVWRATYLLPSPHFSWVHSEHQTPVLTSVWRDLRECQRLELDRGEEYNGSHDSDDYGTVEIKISKNKGFDDRFQFYRDDYYWYSDSRVLNTTQFEIFI